MKHTNTFGNVVKKLLAFVLVLAIAVTFSQPLNAEAKAKVNKVKLAKQGLAVDTEIIKNVAKPLKKGKNNVTVYSHVGTTYQGYAMFVAPETKTYTFKFGNVKGKRSAGLILGNVTGYYIKGQTAYDAKIGPKKNMNDAQIGSKSVSVYKKTFTSKIALEEGQTIYLFYNLSSHAKVKSIKTDVTIK